MDSTEEKRRRLLECGPYSPLKDDRFVFGGRTFSVREIVDELAPFLTDERRARIDAVLSERTRTIVPVVEGLVNMGNVSAVMRSAEALGCQDFHVVTGGESFKDSKRTSQGAEKWLDVFQWSAATDCAAYLKSQGYRIVATHLSKESIPIGDLDFTTANAIIFGNERDGISGEMLRLADANVTVPMVGFVQSFNISVAAAVTLYHACRDRLDRQGHHGDLTAEEIEELRAVYYLRSVNRAEQILAEAAGG